MEDIETISISTKGQISIPARFRKKYGLKQGETLIFIEQDRDIIIKPRTSGRIFVAP